MISALPPGLILIAGAGLIPFVGEGTRKALSLILPIVALVLIWSVGPDAGVAWTAPFMGYDVAPVSYTPTGVLFATVFGIMAFGGALFAMRSAARSETAAAYLYAGSALGVVLAGDLITVFVFWEIMAMGSTMVVWNGASDAARRAGMRYALIHFFGGVVLMIGLIGHISETGSVTFEAMQTDSWARWLILGGFLINAGAWPISSWIPDAYPEASPTGMVFLSAFTTKTAVFVLLVGFPGTQVLIYVGLFMVFYGIIYALLENDMRRILAYSIVNQVGFMVTAIGIGTELALNGAASHAFAHIIYKGLLLMSAGSVLYMTGKRKCTDLGGLFQSMPITATCGIIGALAISAFPLTSGFVSKSMISQSAADQHMFWVWMLLTAASAGVFLHAGIKFPWFVFFQKDSGLRPPDPPWTMRAAMIFFAALCLLIGIFPQPLYALLPFPVEFVPYTGAHVVAQLQLLLFSGLAFFLLLPLMKRTLTVSLDVDWLYRRLAPAIVRWVSRDLQELTDGVFGGTRAQLTTIIASVAHYHGPTSLLARTLPTGQTVFWVLVILAAFLVFNFI
jgi:multicomponent Na+:H+ antiporter subunit D